MFLIAYKKGLNAEKSKVEFDRPLTFTEANDMLHDAVIKHKQIGQSIKLGYKIIEVETGESVFNSKIIIDRDIPSLFQIIKENKNAPKTVIDYVTRVENREINESEENMPFKEHSEEKAILNKLIAEKNEILQQLKRDEKESQLKEVEYQKKIKAIQDEKRAIEMTLMKKEKEDAIKESERAEAIRLIEEQKNNLIKQMEEKRLLDKKRKEEYEKRLREVEEEAKKAEIELKSIEAKIEREHLLRRKKLQEIEQKKQEANRKMNLLKAEDEIEDAKYKQEITKFNRVNTTPDKISEDPKETIKEKFQNLDLEDVKSGVIHFIKNGTKQAVKGSKSALRMIKNHRETRLKQKQEKLQYLGKQAEIEQLLATEKMKFMEELKREYKNQQKQLLREAKQKEREILRQKRYVDLYRAAKNRSTLQFRSLKFVLAIVVLFFVGVSILHYNDVNSAYSVLNEIKSHIERLLAEVKLNLIYSL